MNICEIMYDSMYYAYQVGEGEVERNKRRGLRILVNNIFICWTEKDKIRICMVSDHGRIGMIRCRVEIKCIHRCVFFPFGIMFFFFFWFNAFFISFDPTNNFLFWRSFPRSQAIHRFAVLVLHKGAFCAKIGNIALVHCLNLLFGITSIHLIALRYSKSYCFFGNVSHTADCHQ